MKTIGHILARYVNFLKAALAPLGIFGVFAIAAIDGAFLGMPIDAIVAFYVYQHRTRFLVYVLMAAAGSTAGSLVIYVIGHGGEELIKKRIPPERFAKFHAAFEKHPVWSLMFPAMLPPPTPFKMVALAAAVSGMRPGEYLLAILAGRFVRFLVLAILTLVFGPEVALIVGTLFRKHLKWVLIVLAAALLTWLVVTMLKRRRRASRSEDQTSVPDQLEGS